MGKVVQLKVSISDGISIRRRYVDEEKAVLDRGGIEAGGTGSSCGGSDPAGRDFGADFYRWKRQFGGLESDQVRELKQVVEENGRLKKLVAELSLDKAVLQDVLSKKFPGQRS